MSREHETAVVPESKEYAPPQRVHYKGAGNDQALLDDPQQALDAIETFAHGGKGDASQIVHIARALTFELKQQVAPLMKPLAQRLSGDQLMQLGEIAGVDLALTVELALHARPALGADHLRRYLRGLDPASLATIGDDAKVFAEIRKVMPGALATELPALADLPTEIHGKPRLVEWYLGTTDKTVAALQCALRASVALAGTLDHLGSWAWIDDLHVGRNVLIGTGLETLRDSTANAAAKARIQKVLGSFRPSTHLPMGPDGNAAREEVATNLADHGDTSALLDASARAGYLDEQHANATAKRLAGESSSAFLEFAVATLMDLQRSVPLLLGAPGVTAEQLTYLMVQFLPEERAKLLVDERLRAKIRRVLGASTPLTQLFPTQGDRESAHATLYGDEALRQWAYRDKNPETTLWIAAGGTHAAEACKIVRREVGYAWVTSLPLTAPNVELRRFALNCGDEKMVAYVHEHLLGDRTFKIDPAESVPGPKPGDLYGDRADFRLQDEVSKKPNVTNPENAPDPKTVIARLGDLDAKQRTAVLANRTELAQIFDGIAGAETIRAVFLLGPTLAQLMTLPIRDGISLLDYVATRAVTEQNVVVENSGLLASARSMFKSVGPHVVFPVLRQPAELARALKSSPVLLDWILEDSDPSFAMTALSEEPVRSAAVRVFEERPELYDKLPAYKHLLPRGRQAFDSIAKGSKDEDARGVADDYKSGTLTPDGKAELHAQRVEKASAQNHLWFAIETLQSQHGTLDSALALVQNAPPAERVALLAGEHTASVEKLRMMAPLSPLHVFPGMSTQQLLALPDAASWMLEAEPAYAVLSRLPAGSAGLTALARVLESNVARGNGWIRGLPDAAGLTDHERGALDSLAAQMSNEVILRALFQKRYGAVADTSFHTEELKKIWTVLARLPPSQVNQHVIADFNHGAIGKEAAGLWYSPHIVLSDDPKQLAGNETSYESADVLTPAQVKQYYGLEGDALAAASNKDGWLEKTAGGYRVKEVNTTPQLDATVLHEVGHSVDTMLGEHTDLIYGQAGWKAFGVDQFDEWATQMGALKGVTGADREKVIAAWKESLRAGKPVNEMVAADHPAMKLHADDPLAQEAAAGGKFEYKQARHQAHGDHVFVSNGLWLYTVNHAAAQVAPSEYSMSAPAEYFAECYVEYYRGYKGTNDTAAMKGGHLPAWIKKWFDTHVDNVRLAPDRISGGKDAKPDAPNKKPKSA